MVRRTKTWNYFISSVRKYFTVNIQSKGSKSLLPLPFVCCRRLQSHEWIPEPMFVHINCAVSRRKNYSGNMMLACLYGTSKLWCCLLSASARSIITRACFQSQIIAKSVQLICIESKLTHDPLAVLFATPRS